MENNKKLALMGAVMVLLVGGALLDRSLWKENKQLKQELQTEKSNVRIASGETRQYMTKDSLHVAQVKALQMSVEDYKQINADYERQIAKLQKDKKTKVIEYSQVVMRDTIRIHESDTVKKFIFDDTCVAVDNQYLSYVRCGDDVTIIKEDTIQQTISKHYAHKFLWWRWGNDGITQDIWSNNPYSHFEFNTFVKFDE